MQRASITVSNYPLCDGAAGFNRSKMPADACHSGYYGGGAARRQTRKLLNFSLAGAVESIPGVRGRLGAAHLLSDARPNERFPQEGDGDIGAYPQCAIVAGVQQHTVGVAVIGII